MYCEYLTPQKSAIKALKKYAGDKLSNNEIFRCVGVPRRLGYQILKGEARRNPEQLKKRGRPKKLSEEALAKADSLL
jgi:hypothetical protein